MLSVDRPNNATSGVATERHKQDAVLFNQAFEQARRLGDLFGNVKPNSTDMEVSHATAGKPIADFDTNAAFSLLAEPMCHIGIRGPRQGQPCLVLFPDR